MAKRTLWATPHNSVEVEIDDLAGQVRWGVKSLIDGRLLDANKYRSNHGPQRAPLGDSHGAWFKEAEIPVSVLFQQLPPEHWEDEKALAKILNDPDNRAWRTSGSRRF